ncbi:MAG: NAD-dependent epimerase/dehydratase family protein [Chthoniobacterales bacterium]
MDKIPARRFYVPVSEIPQPASLADGFFRDRAILITGGLGFIGSNLGRRLAAAGARVELLDCLVPEQGGHWRNVADYRDRVRIHEVDLRDTNLTPLVAGQDFIFNLAGQTSHLDSMENPAADLAYNCAAQLALLEACRKSGSRARVVFASTRQIYGRPHYLPVDEKHPLQPVDINGIHKMAAENYHLLYNEVHGLPCTVLRLTNTIGPGMRIRDARQTFLGVWMRQLLEGQPIDVWNGGQVRDFTDVEDAVDAMLLAAQPEAVGQVYNLGGPCTIRLGELAELLIDVHGSGSRTVRPFPEERRRIDIGDYHADFSRIKMELGWEPRIFLRETLVRTLAYYEENLGHYL